MANSTVLATLTLTLLGLACLTFGHTQDQNPLNTGNIFDSIKNNIIDGPGIDNMIQMFFGNDDDEHQKQELNEHFGYIRGASEQGNGDIAQMAQSLGIKPEFLNFKAHDYDNNDKIDGLELFKLMEHEHASSFTTQNSEQRLQLISQIIDRLFYEEDQNQDGFLDFTEYNNARQKLIKKF